MYQSQRGIRFFHLIFLCQSKLIFLRVVLARFNDWSLCVYLTLNRWRSYGINHIYKLLQVKMFFKLINTNIWLKIIIIRLHTIIKTNSLNLFYKILKGLLHNGNYFWTNVYKQHYASFKPLFKWLIRTYLSIFVIIHTVYFFFINLYFIFIN